jgi:hypothetical protein
MAYGDPSMGYHPPRMMYPPHPMVMHQPPMMYPPHAMMMYHYPVGSPPSSYYPNVTTATLEERIATARLEERIAVMESSAMQEGMLRASRVQAKAHATATTPKVLDAMSLVFVPNSTLTISSIAAENGGPPLATGQVEMDLSTIKPHISKKISKINKTVAKAAKATLQAAAEAQEKEEVKARIASKKISKINKAVAKAAKVTLQAATPGIFRLWQNFAKFAN